MKVLVAATICLLMLAACETQQKPTLLDAEQKAEGEARHLQLLLNNQWTLEVKSPDGQIITSVQVRFTDSEANSCMGGDWKKVILGYHKTKDKRFFPLEDEISYQIEGNNLTLGRNQICDAYLHLNAFMDNVNINGEYYSYGKGGKYNLGSFSLIKQ